MKLIGPFKQILTLNHLPLRGKISDEQLEVIENGGILINNDNLIEEIGNYDVIANKTKQSLSNSPTLQFSNSVVLPAFIDCHTHICFGGNRANDFAMRMQEKPTSKLQKKVAEFGARFSIDRKSTRLNSSHLKLSRMPSSA